MQYRGISVICFLLLLAGFTGCGTSDTFSRQNQWLAANYPDRSTHLTRLYKEQPDNSRASFRDAVLSGQVQAGMSLDEVLIATDTAPFGPKPYKGKFWCEGIAMPRCRDDCQQCEGVVILPDRIVRFSGHYQSPTVTVVDTSLNQGSIFTAASSLEFRIAEALYHDEIVKGMSIHDVSLVLGGLALPANFYCDDQPVQTTASCSSSCSRCRIEVGGTRRQKTIFLEQSLGKHRVRYIQP